MLPESLASEIIMVVSAVSEASELDKEPLSVVAYSCSVARQVMDESSGAMLPDIDVSYKLIVSSTVSEESSDGTDPLNDVAYSSSV